MNTATRKLSLPTEPVKFSPSDIARFWAKVDKSGPLPDQANPHYEGLDQCWQWTAAVSSAGYGQIWINRKQHGTHRVSMILAGFEIPAGLFVLHRCDNERCCNPSHLWIGNSQDNMSDKTEKGRCPSGDKNGQRRYPERTARGERQGLAKLSEEKIREIRSIHSSGGISYASIAKAFSVDPALIRRICIRTIWKHVV